MHFVVRGGAHDIPNSNELSSPSVPGRSNALGCFICTSQERNFMKIWKLTYNELCRDEEGTNPVRADPATVACDGDGMKAVSILSDAVRGPKEYDSEVDGEIIKWTVVGIEIIGIELVTVVDHVDPSLRLRATG